MRPGWHAQPSGTSTRKNHDVHHQKRVGQTTLLGGIWEELMVNPSFPLRCIVTSMSKKEVPVLGLQMLNTPGVPTFWRASRNMVLPKMGRLLRLKLLASFAPFSCSSFLQAASNDMPLSKMMSLRCVWSPL